MGKEVVQWLVTDPNGDYADFTAGGGGHIRLILERLAPSGRVCGIDRDPEAIAEVRRTCPHSIELWNIRFSEACRNISTWSSAGLSGVLLDFGVSSRQLDSPSRGFSYRNSGPLDLRMNPAKGEDAASLLARLSEREIIQLLRQYGEEPQAARIGKAIFRENSLSPIRSTDRLAEIVRQSVPAAAHKALPRVFQSLRIAVNQEIEELNMGLEAAWEVLRIGGRILTLTYHSLEDRPVKQFFQSKLHPASSSALSPFAASPPPLAKLPVKGPLSPTPEEITQNPRARSAKLRVIEKIR
ncbi:16S rRNA (cytosine(1402)-N(4))-methyltransferase RsmH [bacterium]|nr:16S rRNA (cytosine(1402)-N(4))-methyltransferase RsmH [bacterium]